jgi:Ca2+-binding EF-hand superfamily protein
MAESNPLNQEQMEELNRAMLAFYEQRDDSQLTVLFRLFDRDHNGTISAAELKTVMSDISGEIVSDNEIKDMIEEADTNRDGLIQLGEFAEVMKKHRG